MKQEYEKTLSQNRVLKRTIKDLRRAKGDNSSNSQSQNQDTGGTGSGEGKPQDVLTELQHAKEALSGKLNTKRYLSHKEKLCKGIPRRYNDFASLYTHKKWVFHLPHFSF